MFKDGFHLRAYYYSEAVVSPHARRFSPEGLPPDSTSMDTYVTAEHPMLYVYNRKMFDASKAMQSNKRLKITSQILEARAEQREESRKEIQRNIRKTSEMERSVSFRPTRVMMLVRMTCCSD